MGDGGVPVEEPGEPGGEAVTIITVATNLAVAVFAGVVVSSLNFAWKSAQRITSSREVEPNAAYGKPAAVFKLNGPLFFGSVTQFREMFSSQSCKQEKEEVVVLDFMQSRVWDSSALEAISDVVITLQGKEIHIRHLKFDELKAQQTRRRPPSQRQRRPRGPPSASWRATSPGGTAA